MKMYGRVLLVLISVLAFLSMVNGDISNNTSSIYNNNSSPHVESLNLTLNKTTIERVDSTINKTIILKKIYNNSTEKSKVTIKIYRRHKETSGFEVMLIVPIITIIYIKFKIRKRLENK